MKRFGILFFGLLLSTVAQSEQCCLVPIISLSDFQHEVMLSRHKDKNAATIISVLSKNTSRDCIIPGSINIPIDKLPKFVKSWPKAKKIILYCAGADCPLSRYAYDDLHKMGFENVRVFDGGLRLWKQHRLMTAGRCSAGYLKGC